LARSIGVEEVMPLLFVALAPLGQFKQQWRRQPGDRHDVFAPRKIPVRRYAHGIDGQRRDARAIEADLRTGDGFASHCNANG